MRQLLNRIACRTYKPAKLRLRNMMVLTLTTTQYHDSIAPRKIKHIAPVIVRPFGEISLVPVASICSCYPRSAASDASTSSSVEGADC